ncbi:hypothetical protein BC835DRAFT_1338064 [Cytidiella melzeri]|nr:hypothetical protein BC835DRAFT_1338064 [Cytidiella melzeri]
MDVYYAGEQKFRETVVYTIGNPLQAKDVLKHDMSAGLDIPPKLLVQEMDNGGTSILYDLPSSVMLGGKKPNPEMKAALESLDSKFEMLVNKVLSVGNKL